MATEIHIPQIGITMAEAMLTEWLAADGAAIKAGTPLHVLEMDQSTNEIDAPVLGKFKIIGDVGEGYEIGTLIATIE